MNTNVYIDDRLFERLQDYIKQNNVSRSFLIREALNAWLTQHAKSGWKEGFFDFEAIEDFPLPHDLRKNLLSPKENPFS
ncbi:MAG TPA: CopG family transcriptional regulator [Alphaproteobacteria bacterium]|nr:CopG family transcriptional regulator [Alphaproteobacteria bacterium]HQS94814.1 CopG family transcriptional regulator [Alphaproteobacteria bacterium]